MKVQLLVSKNDFALRNLLKQCMDNNIEYELTFMEENPELVDAYQLTTSPNILINGRIADGLPIAEDLDAFCDPVK